MSWKLTLFRRVGESKQHAADREAREQERFERERLIAKLRGDDYFYTHAVMGNKDLPFKHCTACGLDARGIGPSYCYCEMEAFASRHGLPFKRRNAGKP